MPSKQIKHWLVIDWKKGQTRTRKSKPSASNLGTHEITTKLTLDIVIPEVDVPELSATVEVPQPRVEASELLDVAPEDVPDWVDVADELIPDDASLEDADHYTVAVLMNAPDRPDAEEVRRVVRSRIRQLETEDEA